APPSLLHHRREFRPGPRRGVLPAELLGAVALAARGDARGDPAVHSRGVHRDRRAEALAHDADALRIDVGAAGEKRQRVSRVPDLLLADDAAALAFALAAAAEI